MVLHQLSDLSFLLGGGVALGLVFYGGLWITLRRLRSLPYPGLVFAGSFLLRTALVVGGILWLTQGHLARLAAVLAGFLLVRVVLTRMIRPSGSPYRLGLLGRLTRDNHSR